MKNTEYYEIVKNRIFGLELNAIAFAGNVQYNGLHWHEQLEILCCVHGSFSLRVDDRVYHLAAGDLFVINGGESHEIFNGTDNGLQLVISIDPVLLHKKATEIYDFNTVGETALRKNSDEVVTVLKSLGKMTWLLTPELDNQRHQDGQCLNLSDEEDWNCFHMELFRVLMYLARHKQKMEEDKDLTSPKALFKRCVEIVHQDYGQPLSAKALALLVGVSEPTIYRMFQKHLGVSFVSYLNSVRINAACGYLAKSDRSIMDIAECCGFSSHSNFYRVFREYKGQAPKAYRSAGRKLLIGNQITHQSIMDLNRFRGFGELPYDRDELLL